MQYCPIQRPTAPSNSHPPQPDPSFPSDPTCPLHSSKITSVCQIPSCSSLLCRKCQETHSHKQLTSLPEFSRRASRDLQFAISSLKENKQQLKTDISQQKQHILTVVDKFFERVEFELERELEKAVCQLETRYLEIRSGGQAGVVEQLRRGCEVRLPTLEVDPSTICLETVLERMMFVKRGAVLASIEVGVEGSQVERRSEQRSEQRQQQQGNSNAAGFFAFPENGKSYLPPQPKVYQQRKNVSLERDVGAFKKSQFSPAGKEYLLKSSKMFRDRSQPEFARPSIQPFNQIINEKPTLKENVPDSNIFDRVSSVKKFTTNEIQEILRKTSPKKPEYVRQSQISTKNFIIEVPMQKQNQTMKYNNQKYFDYKTLSSKYQDYRPTQFQSKPNKTVDYRPSQFTETVKPSTAGNSYKEYYQRQYNSRTSQFPVSVPVPSDYRV